MAKTSNVQTVKTVIFWAEGQNAKGEPIKQRKRAPEKLWDFVGKAEGMAKWLQDRDPRYAVNPTVTFIRIEDTKADELTKKPKLPGDEEGDGE